MGSVQAGVWRRSRTDLGIASAVLTWVPLVLVLDTVVGATLAEQRLLGAGTWLLLLALLRGEPAKVRAQVAVVVCFATLVEYTFSPLLGVYTYRLHNVPAFVPPGHGLVYLCALALGRSALFTAYRRRLVPAMLVVGGGYAAWGLALSPRLDVLGAFWFCCLAGFCRWGRAPAVYVGAFLVVTYLEILGTSLGTWTWAAHDPTGLVAIGNPPSGAAGGYGWFDAAGFAAAPWVLAAVSRLRRAAAARAPRRAGGRSSTARSLRPAPESPSGR